VVGDPAEADIGGGKGAGLRTVWMRRGRDWIQLFHCRTESPIIQPPLDSWAPHR